MSRHIWHRVDRAGVLERIVFAGMCIGRLVVLSFRGITPARYLARVGVPAFFFFFQIPYTVFIIP